MIVLVGGRGFFGSAAAQRLDAVVTVDERSGGERHVQADIRDVDALVRAFTDADVVVNFVGLSPVRQPRGVSYEQIHVRGARCVAEAAEQAGVEYLVHVSALGASQDATTQYLRTKARGERQLSVFSGQKLVLRPSMLYGADSELVKMLRRISWTRMFFRTSALLQPVFVADAARVVADCVADRRTGVLEVGGPDLLTLSDIAELLYAHEDRSCVLLPSWLARLGATALAILPRTRFGFDQVRSLDLHNTLDPSSDAEQLITDTSIADWVEELK